MKQSTDIITHERVVFTRQRIANKYNQTIDLQGQIIDFQVPI